MKCSEAERRIYLYDELSVSEKNQTDVHLENCSSCQHLLERVNTMRKVVTAQDVPPMSNHAQMTRRIMDAVLETGRRRIDDQAERASPFFLRLRYVMAALSISLIVFFAGEYASLDSRRIVKHYPIAAGQTQLNLASFHSAFFEAKGKQSMPTLISHCVTDCLHDDCSNCPEKFKGIN